MTIKRQALLFGRQEEQAEEKYTAKIESPIYEPSATPPHIMELCDSTRTTRLIAEIEASNVPPDVKKFLVMAAWRHAVFHYEKIADYYAGATPEIQRLMESSALVIIDFDAAIERGFVRLCDEVQSRFVEEFHNGK